jgi:hypothetical protein
VEGYVTEAEKSISISHLENNLIKEEGETVPQEARFVVKNNSKKPLQLVSIESSVDYLEPVTEEMILLAPGEEREIIIKINKENIADLYIGEKIQEYIYFNIALPVNIGSGI